VPRFAFGHGLGYKTWEQEPAVADSAQVPDQGALGVTVVARSTGSRAGREVVQADVEPHSRDRGRPLRTLAAFATVTAKPDRAAGAGLAIAARACARSGETSGRLGPAARRVHRPHRQVFG
jgi:beta-glucosidase